MADHNLLGKKGESIATSYIEKKGYVILAQNWRDRNDEIDIIAKYKNQLIFVEVKTRRSDAFGEPELAITQKKQHFLIRAANAYIIKNDFQGESRFDVLSILYRPNKIDIYHIEDAFYPSMI